MEFDILHAAEVDRNELASIGGSRPRHAWVEKKISIINIDKIIITACHVHSMCIKSKSDQLFTAYFTDGI